jgi:integrase
MFSVKIIYDRKRTADDTKEGYLEVRITHERKSYYIGTGVRVLPKHWAGAVVARPDADALNNRLGIVVRRVNEKMNEFIDARKPVDVEAIKQYIYAGTVTSHEHDTFLTWVKNEIPKLDIREGTRNHYWLLYDRLKEYGKMRDWRDLTVENIYDFDSWLHNMENVNANANGEGLSNNTVRNYHKKLKAIINRAVDMGIIEQTPYARLHGRFKGDNDENIEYLTEEQMQMVMNIHPVHGSQMEAARDLFVFQMFTGLSYADAQAFDISKYRREVIPATESHGTVKERWVRIGERIKTGVPYVSVLLPPVIDVLERHGWVTPQIPNQKYNWLLKTLGTVIGIERMHSHLARHTFATYMLSHDVKVQNVMRMLGHKKIEQTMRYAKVIAKDVQKDFDRVGEYLEKSIK